MRAAWLGGVLGLIGGCATVAPPEGPASVLSVDEEQRAVVVASDLAGLERLAYPKLRINAPGGKVLTRDQFFANMRAAAALPLDPPCPTPR